MFRFHFPSCTTEGGRSDTISSFPGVSGQQATLPTGWEWYDEGFYNRPALKSDGTQLMLISDWPQGRRSFQFLWYCNSPTGTYDILNYSMGAFRLGVSGGALQGVLPNGTPVSGVTTLQSDTWYLIQINTQIYQGGSYNYSVEMNVYIGGTLDLTAFGTIPVDQAFLNPVVYLTGASDDGFDEIRHLNRELYSDELSEYAAFIKSGRVAGKSQGSLGSVGW